MANKRWITVNSWGQLVFPPEMATLVAEIMTHAITVDKTYDPSISEYVYKLVKNQVAVEFVDGEVINAAIVAAKLTGETK